MTWRRSLVAVAALVAGPAAATSDPPPPSTVATDQPGEPLELGLPPLTLLAPATTDAGPRPLFSWELVVGAATYSLAIVTTEDVPLWAWEGPATEVILGGWPTMPSPEAYGPLITAPAEWFVVAYDASGAPIANSVIRPVAP